MSSFGAVAPAGASTDSFFLTSDSPSTSGQSSVGWQVGLGNPPATPNTWADPITLSGQIDSGTGAISGATLSMPSITQPPTLGQTPTFTFTEVHPGTATGTFNSATGAVTLTDTLRLSFNIEPINYTCDSSPINVNLSGTWDPGTENVTLTASGFTIPQFPDAFSIPTCSGGASSDVLAGINASPGGIAGSVGNSMSLALHGQFTPGLPTTTALQVAPDSPQLAGASVTLTATVTDPSSAGTPTGSVSFLDNGASVGSGTLDNTGTATLTTTSLSGGPQQLSAAYLGDPTYAASTSSNVPYTITPLPSLNATLPTSLVVPTSTAQPTVTAVSPNTGPAAGGTTVTVTGSGFTSGGTTVYFDTTPATQVHVGGSASLTATSPPGTGTVDVTVTTPNGTSATSVADLFSYGAPTVTAISPSVGVGGGPNTGTAVTVTGTGFVSNATASFGGTPAIAMTVNSATSITAVAPNGPSGVVDLTVTTGAGTSPTSAADQFTYTTGPIVTGLVTPAGPAAGGTSVVIDGFNMSSATAVNFGSSPGTITANTATSVTAKSPPGTSGTTVDVTVTTPNGTSPTSSADQFTYGPPTVTGVSPNSGPVTGGTSVTITGTGFAPSAAAVGDGPSVKFGTFTIGASSVTVNSPTSLTVTSPAGTGTVDITVTSKSGGTSATSPADQFTYAPTVTAVSPPSGPTGGGTSVTITGTAFTGATAVAFGTKAATNVVVSSATSITATSPSGTAGAVDVTVTTPVGTSATSAADQFFYGAPTVTAVSPSSGPLPGGTPITITGTGLLGTTAVTVGGNAATNVTAVSATQVTAVTPSATSTGAVSVVATTPGGTTTKANAFTYSNGPSISSISPSSGPAAGDTVVILTGANFTGTEKVSFGTTATASYQVNTDSSLTVTSPAGTGTVDITVTTPTGASAIWSGDQFTYTSAAPPASPAPTVTGVAPNIGSIIGGTTVSITGTNFVSGAAVSFGSTPATSVTVKSSSWITAVSPAENTGPVDVTVKTSGGTSTTSSADQFIYNLGGDAGFGSLTVTNPTSGQSWDNLYVKVVLAGITSEPASNVALAYQDSSGDWCPLTLSGTTTITGYFSGAGSSCGSAPGSMSLPAGSSITVPIELSYASGTYMGNQTVTATLYSGTCSGPVTCTQSGDLNGSVVNANTISLVPAGSLSATVTDISTTRPATTTVRQGFDLFLSDKVAATATATGTPTPTGTVSWLVDGNPVSVVSVSTGAIATSVVISASGTGNQLYDTAGLAPGTHTLTVQYSGDAIFASTSLVETFSLLPPPTGTPYTCTATSGLTGSGGTFLGTVTATSTSPSPTLAGTDAWVGNLTVSLDLDPAAANAAGAANAATSLPATFGLSPAGAPVSVVNPTFGPNANTDNIGTWAGMSAMVPVSGSPGSSMPVSLVGPFSYQPVNPNGVTIACTPVSADPSVTSIPVAGNVLTASPSGSVLPGAPVTLTDTVYPPPATTAKAGTYGQVDFYDGSTDLGTVPVSTTAGTATLNTNQLAVGDHQLTAMWSGGGGVPANTSAVVDYQVGTLSTTTLTSSANPANAAKAVTFTAAVNGSSGSPSPTGDVSFTADGTSPASCQNVALSTATPPTATCKLSFKAGSTHSVVATYSGDATYIGSSSDPLSQSMLPGTTSTLTTPKNPAPAGNVTFWDGVAATGGGTVPTGTVAFTVDNKASTACAHQPLGPGGGASCTLNFKAGTTHTVSATYAGSSSYSGSKSNTISLKVSGTSSATKPKVTTASATLGSGKTLTAGQSISTGSYKLVMQSDGNLVEYQGSKARWASGTSGHAGTKVTMQTDGNLVEYQGSHAIWASNTSGHTGAHLTLQGSDGNVVIYQGTTALWAAGT